MKETNFYSNHLIEIFRIQYQLDEPIINHFDNIIKDESNAFKIILFLTQIETIVPDDDLEYRLKVLGGVCLYALRELSENSATNLYWTFLKKYPMNRD